MFHTKHTSRLEEISLKNQNKKVKKLKTKKENLDTKKTTIIYQKVGR